MSTLEEHLPPLCDKCRVPMWDSEPKGYKCREPGCSRRYNSKLGYFDYAGAPETVEQQRRCPNDQSPLFLDAISPEAIETWRCPQCSFELKNQCHLPFESGEAAN
jgi:hypothetical protein